MLNILTCFKVILLGTVSQQAKGANALGITPHMKKIVSFNVSIMYACHQRVQDGIFMKTES